MANQNKELQLSEENFDFDELEKALEQELDAKTLDLELATKDREKIGDPISLAEATGNVAWEQFMNLVGPYVGEDFFKENRGLTLDLRDDAHIQTAENFAKGKIAKHNYKSKEMLEENYKRYKDTPHSKFRKEFVDPKMNSTLPRVGKLKDQGIKTVTDIYTGRQISTQTKLEDGSQNPNAAQREHVIPSAKLYKDPSLQMANTSDELADTINNPENLQGYTTAKRNLRKSDSSPTEMEDCDKNRHWEKANQKAEKYVNEKKKEGEERLKKEGLETQEKEKNLIKGELIRSVIMTLLTALMKEILQKLVVWFKSAKKSISTFMDSLKESVKSFLSNLKQYGVNVLETVGTTLLSAIIDPIMGTIKKSWVFLKQGYKSLKEAINFFKDPKNQNMPFSFKVMEVSKIITAGLTAGGAILLSEAIEKGLMAFPIFAYPIPFLGSLASLLGLFFGALISGIIGAIALNLIDKLIASTQRELADKKIIEAGNEVRAVQSKQLAFEQQRVAYTKEKVRTSINARHAEAAEFMKETITDVNNMGEQISRNKQERQTSNEVENELQAIYNLLNK